MAHTHNGAEVILELLRTNGIDCVFASPIATMAPLYTSQTWNIYKYFADGAAARSGQFFGNVIAPTPENVKLAEAYGGTGERVENGAALGPAIERALAALADGRSALLDVFLAGGKWQG